MNKQIQGVLRREYILPKSKSLSLIFKQFSPFESVLFLILLFVFVSSTLILVSSVNKHALVVVPTSGGSFSEGVIGSPRFINPLLAQSDSDRDRTKRRYRFP